MKFLIVIDMQNDFISMSLKSEEAEKILPNVLKKIEEFDGELVLTRDTHYENYLLTFEGKNLPVEHCIKNTKGWQIDSRIMEIIKNRNFHVIEKETFGFSEFGEYLTKLAGGYKIESIEIIGVCTSICVVSNALILRAYFKDIPIIVDPDCCACVNNESHEKALAVMKMCQIEIK